ncbi:DEMETER-like protein 3 [Silene latifolia]|uniref:DEMETER-like protein 3 n=1 Tax=Silene latifolia TaxID=37657 RepID=UPI003D78014A
MESEQHNYSFVPITPGKTLNCTVNCAITSVDNPGLTSTTIRSDSGGDIDSISNTLIGGNVLFNGSVLPASISMATTASATLWMGSDAGLDGTSCSKTVRSDTVNQSGAVPDGQYKNDEVILTHRKNKKRKVGPDLNRKPGEKRQNKYYWAKIDVPRPNTPAPKTPKAVTPKPPKAKTPKTSKPRRKNDKRKPNECCEIFEHLGEQPIIDSTCKKSLNFEPALASDLEPGNVSEAVEFSFGKTTKEATLPSDLQPDNEKKTNDTMCTQGLKPNIKIKEKSALVYRRRFNSKCLYICQNLVPKFEKNFKRKRLQRNKKSFGALKRFEGFNGTCLTGSLLDRILCVKGKLRMLMPTKGDFFHDPFNCVLSLLSSRPVFKIKKRLPRARRSTKPLVHPYETTPISAVVHQDETTPILAGLSAGKECDNSDIDLVVLHGVNKDNVQTITPTPSTLKDLQVYRGRKPDVIKDKNPKPRRTSKPKGKQNELQVYRGRKPNVIKDKNSVRTPKLKGKLGKLRLGVDSDWTVANVEEFVNGFALRLRSLKLYDDPKTWIVEVSDQNNKTDDFYEKIRFEEERINLFKKMGKFLQEMYYYQGSKDFIKWNGSVLDSVVGVYLTQNVSDFLSSNAYMNLASKYPIKPPTNNEMDSEVMSSQGSSETVGSSQKVIVEHPDDEEEPIPDPIDEEPWLKEGEKEGEYDDALREMLASMPYLQESKKKGKQVKDIHIDWEKIRVRFSQKSQRKPENEDSVDWDAVRKTAQNNVAAAIRHRGQHNIMALKIQQALNRIVDDHGSLDVEWLRDAPPEVAKAYLLSFHGLGLKSVECMRLLSLRHLGFPVDVNIGRIAIRLGWVPIKPLPPGMPFHLLQKYPLEDEIQKYLSSRLCHLKQETLYRIHYQMIQFGKVFCHKRSPNCRACPFKSDCRYYASLSESSRQALPGPGRKTKKSKKHQIIQNPFDRIIRRPSGSLPSLTSNISSCSEICASSLDVESSSQLATLFGNVSQNPVYFVEIPSSPKLEIEEEEGHVRKAEQVELGDIEDCCDGYMYHLELNSQDNERALLNYSQESNISSKSCASREMVSVSANVASLPKLKSVARLRTEHQVYELPKDNQLLTHLKLETQVGDVPYLLAIWTPEQMEKTCDNTEGGPCSSEGECTSRDDDSTIPGTLLIPVQTALRRSFPLNGTYFQMNEVFVDDETCKRPVSVPTSWIWNLKKRTLYCGTSASTIVRGTTEMEIRQCFRQGFICTRGFNRKTRAPVALSSRFHNRPTAKSQKTEDGPKGKSQKNEDGVKGKSQKK